MCSKPKMPAPAPAPAAPVPTTQPDTAEGVGRDEGDVRKGRKAARNSLRIDTNVSGGSGNGLNIPR